MRGTRSVRRSVRHRRPGRLRRVAAAVVLAGACGGGPGTPTTPPGRGVVVASFNFPESRLLAEIYAAALEDEGIEVRREIDLGRRELVDPALRQGLVDVVPEYLGSALSAADPGSAVDRSDPVAVSGALAAAVDGWGLRVLVHAEAQNQNALVVSRATAERLALAATSDLGPVAPSLTLGGPPECPRRPQCLVGLTDVYGLRFAAFVPLDGQAQVRRALEDGVVDVGVLFTTDGALAGDELVVLADDRGLQPAENVVPVVRAAVLDGRSGGRVAAALDEVSRRLTTANLRFLNWRVTVAGNDPAAEARAWLVRQGMVDR
ncbi:MAG TPA: ABC transporter substrate-binding protein [Acidimicrobiales bacterium]|nr:ABC transporter substrate-binding protein [Acidimicrobiales bacterium]